MFDRRALTGLVVAGGCLLSLAAAQDRRDGEKPRSRSGTVVGVVTEKGPNFLGVKAEGEEQARRYVPHWVGGLPQDGGGPDKKMVEVIKRVKVGSRVRLGWEFEERPRVVKVEVLKEPGEKGEEREK